MLGNLLTTAFREDRILCDLYLKKKTPNYQANTKAEKRTRIDTQGLRKSASLYWVYGPQEHALAKEEKIESCIGE